MDGIVDCAEEVMPFQTFLHVQRLGPERLSGEAIGGLPAIVFVAHNHMDLVLTLTVLIVECINGVVELCHA